ncbi:hypothetical protein Micbo1qcDRAFT_159917 [Microdochium bolleyi]|uniref:Sel1 repeat family protein n=1 Tax=Microdochium bolleyi TaxID=196109 RepID=A0A136JBX4_9PEZI|nr:hypothetical protein Micbo1qcDRAFT_159917 [Microdochium bolleyi]
MVRLAQRTQKLGQPQFRPAEAAFRRILDRMKSKPLSADAASLAGILASYELQLKHIPQAKAGGSQLQQEITTLSILKNLNKTIEWYRYAARVGGDEPGAFDWQISCAEGLATCYDMQGNTDRAFEIWEYVAKTLDHPHGCFHYARHLVERGADRASVEEWLLKAAAGGHGEAIAELEISYRRLAERATSKEEFHHFSIMADEWKAMSASSTTPPSSWDAVPSEKSAGKAGQQSSQDNGQ